MTAARCDLLCIAPHTDDAELALGGALALLAGRGRRVWICDLTRGELASNADPDARWREAAAAGGALGVAGRVQLALPDGFLTAADRAQVEAVVWVLRALRPRWVLAAPEPRRHPDHLATPALVERAAFLSRLVNLQPAAPARRAWPDADIPVPDAPWAPEVVGVACREDREPALIIDVTSSWEAKHAALACYASQFRRDPGRRPTSINDPAFLAAIEERGRFWGRRAGVGYGEAVSTPAVPVLDDLPDGGWR